MNKSSVLTNRPEYTLYRADPGQTASLEVVKSRSVLVIIWSLSFRDCD